MWRFPGSERCVSGAEWRLLILGARWALEEIEFELDEGDDPVPLEGHYFSRLRLEQKLAVMLDTLQAMRCPDVRCPKLTAANEGAIAECLSQLRFRLECEIDLDNAPDREGDSCSAVRQSLQTFRDQLRSAGSNAAEPVLMTTSNDEPDWNRILGMLEDKLLWGRDYAGDPEDSWDPNDENYYRSDSPVPEPDEVAELRRELNSLLEVRSPHS
jgi:hypothetical protein